MDGQFDRHNASSTFIKRRISFTALFEEDKRKKSMKIKNDQV
jgi:hypothetical protein